jgi:hypothetical protein
MVIVNALQMIIGREVPFGGERGQVKAETYEDPNIVSQLIEVVDIVWRSKRILREIRV